MISSAEFRDRSVSTRSIRPTCQRFRSGYSILIVFLMGLVAPVGLRAESSPGTIRILGISREAERVSIQWLGGFPPYRLRVNHGSDTNWVELPDFIHSNFFTTVITGPVSLYQVKTEHEPLRLTGIYPDSDFMRLQWRGGIPPYRIEACDGISTNWVELPRLVQENFYTTPSGGNFKFYRVRVEPDTNAPSVPGNLTVMTLECNRIIVGWDAGQDSVPGGGVKGHNLYRDGRIVKQIPAAETFALDSGLLPEHSYDYALTTIDGAGNESARSASLVINTPRCTASGTNGTASGITVAWDRSEEPGVVGYIVHWGRAPGDYPWQMDVMQATEIAVADLQSGTPYFFAITAYDADGIESEPSVVVAYIPP